MNLQKTNIEICRALGINEKNVCSIDISVKPDDIPKIKIERFVDNSDTEYLEIIKNSAEYKEVSKDMRNIILMSEMTKFFYDKLKETDSLDAALLKAVWRAYLKGIQVGSNPELFGTSANVPTQQP